ncbi:MAG TPA: GAF domain-containing SpoIIE family protein phosphatase [Acidimicrobiales bacterium]|nr:GAF domain-containing SpoIIE family protein phosphatase [Acidimicrobiales bacterium]
MTSTWSAAGPAHEPHPDRTEERGDERTRLRTAELAVERLQAERDNLESIVVRLGAVAGRLDAEEVARGITEAVREMTGAPLAMFVPAEVSEFKKLVVVCEPGLLGRLPDPASAPLLGGALWRVTPLRLDDAAQWGTGQHQYGQTNDGRTFRSWVGAPVRARYGDALGVLFLAHYRAYAFGQREEELAQGLAAQLGASLDNLALFQERARVAGALQQTLLPPSIPDIPGLEVATRYRPAKSAAQVGGDFYDVVEVRPGVWGLLLGDVTGVGPEAAALTGVARYAARALVCQVASPASLLAQLNDTLVHFDLQEKFCTALYAELHAVDKGGFRLKLANAGHPYPFIVRADGEVEEVHTQGTLLGLLPNICVEQRELVLRTGDMFVCYTDGVSEARSPDGELFGAEGLARVLPQCAGLKASAAARRIELSVLEYQAGGAPDDMAIIVLHA